MRNFVRYYRFEFRSIIMPKGLRPTTPPILRPVAPHVQAAIAYAAQARLAEKSPPSIRSGPVQRPAATHVQQAISSVHTGQTLSRPRQSLIPGGLIQRAEKKSESKEVSFADWLQLKGGGDHPPNELSVIDAHLPTSGLLVRHDVTKIECTGWRPDFSNPEFGVFIYSVRSGAGNHQVFVVWPSAYKKHPPKENRLGWLPQMEFGDKPGLLNPKHIDSGTTIKFTYQDMSGNKVDLSFTKK